MQITKYILFQKNMLYWPSFSILCNPLLPTVESFLLQYLRLENTEEGVSGSSLVYSLLEFNPQVFIF